MKVDLDHLVERRLVAVGAQRAVVFLLAAPIFSVALVSSTPPQPGHSTFQDISNMPSRAACRKAPIDLFFVEAALGGKRQHVDAAQLPVLAVADQRLDRGEDLRIGGELRARRTRSACHSWGRNSKPISPRRQRKSIAPFAKRRESARRVRSAGGARLKARTLAARLSALAERHIRELEDSASVDPDKLGEALELLRMAKLAARSKRRRSATEAATGGSLQTSSQFWDAGARTVIGSLRSGGVNPERAPEEALQDFIDSRAPPPEKRRRRRGRRDSGNAHHARMLERDER